MRYSRYIVATLTAIAIHGVALSYAKSNKTLTMDAQAGHTSMQLQFVSTRALPEKPVDSPVAKKPSHPQNREETTPATNQEQATETSPKVLEKPTETVLEKTVEPKPEPKLATKPLTKSAPRTEPKPVPKAEPKPVPKTEPKTEPQKVAPLETASEVEPETAPETQETAVAQKASQPKLVTKPTFSAKPTPVSYPRLARNRGWQGRTVVEVWIDEKGKQIKATIHQSSGHESLDNNALKAIKRWRFAAHNEQGLAVSHRVHIPIDFKLN